jgi:hypothetical protein
VPPQAAGPDHAPQPVGPIPPFLAPTGPGHGVFLSGWRIRWQAERPQPQAAYLAVMSRDRGWEHGLVPGMLVAAAVNAMTISVEIPVSEA